MRLFSTILLVFVFALSAGVALHGQCAAAVPGQGMFLTQTPKAKAAMVAAASLDIEERMDPSTGEHYYVRRIVNPWSKAISYQIVRFNPTTEAFAADYLPDSTAATESGQSVGRQQPCPNTVTRDSLPQNRPNTAPEPQPRRSSTIKIAKFLY